MGRLFAAYCTAMVALMGVANHQNYVLTSFFGGSQTADKSANRYHK